LETTMQTTEGYYHCGACDRTYKAASAPEACLVCGAAAVPARAEAGDDAVTAKFKLAAERARGIFRNS
jgi:hypothetical protein